MSLYSQNVSNNPLSLDGLIVGNFDEVYINGQPVTPTDTSGLVPYVGATTAVNLNSQKITTTYTAVNAEDLTNKDFTDNTYLAKAGFIVNSGTFRFNSPATVRIDNADFFISCPVEGIVAVLALNSSGKVVQVTTTGVGNAFLGATQTFFGYNTFSLFLTTTGIINTGNISTTGLLTCANLDITGLTTATPVLALGINASNQVVKFAGGTGDAILAGGTVPFPQQFTGYNAFINPLRISTLTFSTPVTGGTASYILGVDVTGNLVSTTPTTAPSTLTITNTAVSNTYYPTWITSTTTGVKTIFGVNGVSYDLPSGILTTTQLKIGTVPAGTTQYILAVDATGNVIQGTVTAGDAYLANTQTFTGINTFSNQMTLTKGFDLTLGAVNSFIVRNSSLVTQFSVTNTGVTMGNLVMTGTVFNMSSTSPNFIYSGDNLAITASATTSKSIVISVAGTGLTIDQYGASFSSASKKLTCNYIHALNGTVLELFNPTDNINIQSSTYTFYSAPQAHFFYNSGANNFSVSDQGLWMPVSGSKSFYITDTYPNVGTGTYSRYYGWNGIIYQDYYNQFQWRRSPNIDGSAVTTLMSLDSNGLTLNNAVGIGQPQLVFGGSGVPTIRMNGGGMNWFMNNTTNMGYFDAGGYGNGGNINGLGWRINGNDGLTLKSPRGVYLECGGSTNPTINARVPHFGTGLYKWGDNGWFSYGGAFVVSHNPVGNVTTGIGMGVSFDNDWCYFDMVKPGNFWAQGIFETGNANWYCNRTLAAYITTAGWTNVSDARCKHDIHDLSTTKSLQRILKCKPKYYKRIMEEPTGKNPIPHKQEDIDRVHIGLLAQEVQEFNPHCVSTWFDKDESKENEKLGIQYNDFVVHLIGAVQEQQKQIQNQQQTIDTLLSHLAKLTDQVNQITLKMM